jgi:hypothetical protein
MRNPRFEILMAALFLAMTLLFSLSSAASADEELEERVDILAEEIARLREEMSIPETDEGLTSTFGMGIKDSRSEDTASSTSRTGSTATTPRTCTGSSPTSDTSSLTRS